MEDSNDGAMVRFLHRLQLRSTLSGEEQDAILSMKSRTVQVSAHRDIVSPGQTTDFACLLEEGLLGRFDQMLDGSRSTTALHIPGDMCDIHSVVAPTAGWGIAALTASTIFQVPHRVLRDVAASYPAIALAFWRDTTADAAILSKWVANIGRKSARARIAHLLCEMGRRMEEAGLGSRETYLLPATQEQIGDVMGLSPVHINRTLRELARNGIVTFHARTVTVLDIERLARIGEFDPAFLLLEKSASNRLEASSGEAS